ncbi:MAG: undecaprenyl-diphosphate phosphatase [Candidatus Sulfobium sp.]
MGIVQGLTEFLPVSSTAHLVLFPWVFHWGGALDSLTFDIALHAGTLCALLFCLWRDWLEIITKKTRFFVLIIIATVPAGIAGVLLNDFVEHTLRSPYVITASLVAIGLVMLLSEKMYKHKDISGIKLPDAVAIGIAQAIALIPGVSRSGITISAGLFRGLERESSARFSFLLSTPVIAGAVLLHSRKMIAANVSYDFSLFAAGFVASAVTGYFAVRFMLDFFKRHPINVFVYYRFLLAVVIIIGIWLRG